MKSLSLTPPHVIAMVGIPGAGKTQFAKSFADTFSTPFISRHQYDVLTGDLAVQKKATLYLLKEVMKTKRSIVFEGMTDQAEERDELVKFARRQGYEVTFIWTQVDPKTAKKRTAKKYISGDYDYLLSRFEVPGEKERYIVISGHHTYGTQARTVLNKLTERRKKAVVAPPKHIHTTPAVTPIQRK